MNFNLLLSFHIVAALLAFALANVALVVRKGSARHQKVGEAYHWLLLFVCVSAGVMAVIHWEKSLHFLGVAAFTYFFALKGYLAAKRKGPDWKRKHLTGMLGSYIGMWTALLVIGSKLIPGLRDLPPAVFWVLPAVVGMLVVRKAFPKVNSKTTSAET